MPGAGVEIKCFKLMVARTLRAEGPERWFCILGFILRRFTGNSLGSIMGIRRLILLVIGLRLSCVSASVQAGPVDFSREILPILSDNCFYCHGPDASHRKAKLRLDDEMDAKRDRKGEAVIVPGKSDESLLMQRIVTKDTDDLMPPPESNKKLSAGQIAALKRWIDEGAKWGQHWAFEPIKRPEVPAVKKSSALRNPIDAFVINRLIREKLKPAVGAEKTALLRRVTLDLTGLPPTAAEVRAFLQDKSATAYEKVVDRLLASKAYGERMAWDWMEISRYADSNGYQGDAERTMWPWRDWVVKAFNENMPYQQFTTWQLAGDLLPGATQEQQLATAFLRNHPINGEGGRIAEENRVDYVMDMTETTATAWLGLTFTCTRCHDHKFDQLTRQDYYSLSAYFNQTPVDGGGGDPRTKPIIEVLTGNQKTRRGDLKKAIKTATANLGTAEKNFAGKEIPEAAKKILEIAAGQRDKANLETLEKEFEKIDPGYVKLVRLLLKAQKAEDDFNRGIPKVMVMADMETPRKTFILDRGQYNKPADEVKPGTPAKLPALKDLPANRLGLAQWLTAAENPLTARVTVNRVWQMFFGIGLVKTAEDFGVQGEFPLHAELLDWLASEFRDSGWDMKKLIRLIVTSGTYCQSSKVSPEHFERDPANRLLARGPRFRMPSWMLRDQALAASGLLVSKVGGPSVKPYQPAGVWEETTFGKKVYKQDTGEALYRRSLYIFWRRIIGPAELFDTTSRMTCNVKPTRNNTPLHALTTVNNTTYVEAARAMAERVMTIETSPRKRVDLAFQTVLARKPSSKEQSILLAGLDRARTEFTSHPDDAKAFLAVGESKRSEAIDPIEHAAWAATCLAILNLDEALTKE